MECIENLEETGMVQKEGVCYNVHVSNEQCQSARIQIFVFTRIYLYPCGLIGRMPVNERAVGSFRSHCDANMSECSKQVKSYVITIHFWKFRKR